MSTFIDRRLIVVVAAGMGVCLAAGAAIILLTIDYRVVGCESDGHYVAAQMLRCGERGLYVELYKSTWPWLFARLAGFLYGLFNETYLAAKAVSVAFAAGAVAVAMIAVRRYTRGIGASILVAVLLVFDGQFLYYGTLASTDMAAAALFFAGLAAMVRSLDADARSVWSGAAGLAMGFACVTRYQYLIPSTAALIAPLWWFSGSLRQRSERALVWLAGWLAPALMSIGLDYSQWTDAAGFRVVSSRGDTLSAFVEPGLSAMESAFRIAGHYVDGLRLMVWHVGACGVAALAIAAAGARRQASWRRDLIAAGFVFSALFASVSWFTSLDNLDLRRFYLPVLMVGAVAFAAVCARGFASVNRLWFLAALSAWALIGVQRFYLEFPHNDVWGPRGYPSPIVFHPWNGLHLSGVKRADSRVAKSVGVGEGRKFKRLVDHDCRLTITNSVTAASVLPLTYACPEGSPPCFEETGMDNTAVGGLINHLDSNAPPAFVLEFPYRGEWRIDPDAPLDKAPGWSLEPLYAKDGVRAYRIRPPSP